MCRIVEIDSTRDAGLGWGEKGLVTFFGFGYWLGKAKMMILGWWLSRETQLVVNHGN